MTDQDVLTTGLRGGDLTGVVRKWVYGLSDGSLTWTMRIPADPEHDPDLLITRLCDQHEAAVARIRQLEQERDEAVAAWRKESDWGLHAEGLLRQWAELDWLVDTKESTYVAPEDETWEVLRETRAFLAKHPQPAKEQVE